MLDFRLIDHGLLGRQLVLDAADQIVSRTENLGLGGFGCL